MLFWSQWIIVHIWIQSLLFPLDWGPGISVLWFQFFCAKQFPEFFLGTEWEPKIKPYSVSFGYCFGTQVKQRRDMLLVQCHVLQWTTITTVLQVQNPSWKSKQFTRTDFCSADYRELDRSWVWNSYKHYCQCSFKDEKDSTSFSFASGDRQTNVPFFLQSGWSRLFFKWSEFMTKL